MCSVQGINTLSSTEMQRILDIEDHCKNKPTSHVYKNVNISEKDYIIYENMLKHMGAIFIKENREWSVEESLKYFKTKNIIPSKATLMQVYLNMITTGAMENNEYLESFLVSKKCRRISGVTVTTVFLSPYPNGQKFTCNWDCFYCPNEPGQPRSYLFAEPGVLRANQNGFDCVKQMYARLDTYRLLGHPMDKLEVLILGGTIYSYPKDYLETFMRDIYYAANTCTNKNYRDRLTLEEEQLINETTRNRIIGITVETRPDCINEKELTEFRRWGVTRVQIGVQHTDDKILRKINRKCYHSDTLKAVSLLRNNCFKFDVHLMPNLPGATPEKDMEMMDIILTTVQPDQVKIYPTETTPFTRILEYYKKGKYKPYSSEELNRVIVYWKTRVHPWIRNNRIIRDIPGDYIVDGVDSSNAREEFQKIMCELKRTCKCIRCREAGRTNDKVSDGELVIREYSASGGLEYFISWESKPDYELMKPVENNNYYGEYDYAQTNYKMLGYNELRRTLFGFVRLRINSNEDEIIFSELKDCAYIRELHVYGNTISNGKGDENKQESQHLGVGKILMEAAEKLALKNGYKKTAVISGNSVRNYYRKIGYKLEGTYMIKYLEGQEEVYNVLESMNGGILYILIFIYLAVFLLFFYF